MISIELPVELERQVTREAKRVRMKPAAFISQIVANAFEVEDAEERPFCAVSGHKPNAATATALREAERGEGMRHFDSVGGFKSFLRQCR